MLTSKLERFQERSEDEAPKIKACMLPNAKHNQETDFLHIHTQAYAALVLHSIHEAV